ncbi:MAG: hypothetical protein Q9165_003317 [Trypethelium subeluteriae]
MIEKLEVFVIGTGIGGLAAAVGLSTKGHEVTVYERDSEVSEIGAGIQVTPNFTRILRRWGLGKRLHERGVNTLSSRLRRWEDGKVLSEYALNANGYMEKTYGDPYYHIHRADLQAILLEKAKELGVTCKTSTHIVDYVHQGGKERVIFADGTSSTADLVVAADGNRSILAKHVLGHDVPSAAVGDSAYRGLIPREQMQDPLLQDLDLEYNQDVWLGPHSHTVTYYVRSGEMFNFIVALPDEPGEESWKAPGDINKLRKHFESWDPRIRAIASKINQSYIWKLRDRPALERWVHPHGNLVLLGDAAHPMLPYVAQGASSAVEDAAVLAECLSYAKAGIRDIQTVLQAYEKIRKPRALQMKNAARSNRAQFHMPDGPEQQARDKAMKDESTGDRSINMFKDKEKAQFMYGHDVVNEVHEYFQAEAKL